MALKSQFYMYLRSRGFTQLLLCFLLQVCFPCLCSSEHSRLGLDLLHVIIHLKDNTYWLVKVTTKVTYSCYTVKCVPNLKFLIYNWYILYNEE